MPRPRIVSFLPAATEMIYLLGLEGERVGRSHECDYPERVKDKPVIVDCALDLGGLSASQIDAAVSARLAAGQSLEGTQVLAHLAHPERVDWDGPRDAFERLS